MIIAALKVATNLERVGDYAKNIAKRYISLSQSTHLGNTASTIARMSGLVQNMIKNVLDAYLTRDAERAEDIRLRDQEVDQIHSSLFRELLTYMMEDPRNITSCTHQLFIAKNVERIGDHITGVAEQIIFVVSGEAPSEERPKDDSASFAASIRIFFIEMVSCALRPWSASYCQHELSVIKNQKWIRHMK